MAHRVTGGLAFELVVDLVPEAGHVAKCSMERTLRGMGAIGLAVAATGTRCSFSTAVPPGYVVP